MCTGQLAEVARPWAHWITNYDRSRGGRSVNVDPGLSSYQDPHDQDLAQVRWEATAARCAHAVISAPVSSCTPLPSQACVLAPRLGSESACSGKSQHSQVPPWQ
ncbi:hypothetical protein SS50377_28704 [Spironucleus salmonicida]|uniref:Uncharacterized protein n=1 Tax=Spironucleus salmonicida TaxID=348837 RepID=A0A9P8LJY9_9EUKA|nr:hypothetical protein SS50377_28697 [Spironucleus salmonicida]KAH0569739.1 hypothetical protein SS50377_28698 [Spironucleus salmonicida]KAH0569744.1 hypothetical protein SS50377_28703 [Spironucleus salmonicida]KAH0569745.1 hypothetical protein SS50377_28704 [Spironucleus salmonicida]